MKRTLPKLHILSIGGRISANAVEENLKIKHYSGSGTTFIAPGVGISNSSQSTAVSVSTERSSRAIELPSVTNGTDGSNAIMLAPHDTAPISLSSASRRQ